METVIHAFVLLALFAVSFYSISGLRLEVLFRKNSTLKIQVFYFLVSMALAYLVAQFLFSLDITGALYPGYIL